jgi:nucleotide-binding universal stress UspA family protein
MINEILVPVDGSENSEKGLRYACWLAREVNATITVLYVVQIPFDGESVGLPIKPLVDAGRMVLNKAKDIVENEECSSTKFVLREASGNPGHEIVKFSKEMNCSLIIMSAKGHSALKHFLLGSVSETVTKYASCSIMIVK